MIGGNEDCQTIWFRQCRDPAVWLVACCSVLVLCITGPDYFRKLPFWCSSLTFMQRFLGPRRHRIPMALFSAAAFCFFIDPEFLKSVSSFWKCPRQRWCMWMHPRFYILHRCKCGTKSEVEAVRLCVFLSAAHETGRTAKVSCHFSLPQIVPQIRFGILYCIASLLEAFR